MKMRVITTLQKGLYGHCTEIKPLALQSRGLSRCCGSGLSFSPSLSHNFQAEPGCPITTTSLSLAEQAEAEAERFA